ncbi:hypothetical protein, partial [Streptomyces sp. A0592]|uniref:hypothetical protein n=1 Tax=Streptomyces sp. A0592 TaxID=2563099 RepID=UPI00109ECD92
MVRRRKERKKRPAWGIPKGIVLLATPEGWRHSVLTMEGGMLCGRLDVPADTDPQDARAAAARMVADLARDFHDTDVEVSWDPPQEPWSWTAQVTLAPGAEPPPPDVPADTDPQDARAAAARMVADLARDFHDTDVEVSWDPPQEPWSWTAQVTLAPGAEPPPP